MNISFESRTVLVTGGARGIGAAIASEFVESSARVVIADIDHAQARDRASALAASTSAEVLGIGLDVTDEEQVREAIGQIGRVDVLINNAGVSRPMPTVDTTLEHWDAVIRTNLTGAFLCAKHCLPAMIDAGWGRIVSIASFASKSSPIFGDNASYAASKAAILGLTRNLAVEHGRAGVTVNAIAPGIVDTELLRAAHTAHRREALLERLAVGAFTTPEEVAALTVFLASSQARSITGEVVNINGGLYFD